ncbi:hypothetical protein FJZ36_17870, partial [Candidatus Poribacteria bacterium]|nr:hypothetical protein [Candidatus Poribacteria bacterium]
FGPDGKVVFSGSADKTIRAWSAETGRQVYEIPVSGTVRCIAYSASLKAIVSGGSDGVLRLSEPETGRSLRKLTPGRFRPVAALVAHPTEPTIVTAGYEGSWPVQRAHRIWPLTGYSDTIAAFDPDVVAVSAIALNRDGTVLACVVSNGIFAVWAPGVAGRRSSDPKSSIACIAVSPDGSLIATGGRDNAVRIWDTASGEPMATLTSHKKPVTGVAFAPDGSFLVSVSEDGTARLWREHLDLEPESPLTAQPQPTSPIVSLTVDARAFIDLDGDGELADGETGVAFVTLRNAGDASARDVELAVSPETSAGLEYTAKQRVAEVRPGGSVEVRLTFKATPDTPDATNILRVLATESATGRALDETIVTVRTRGKRAPLLAFVKAEVTASPEPGRFVVGATGTLAVTVANRGTDAARNVSLSLMWAGSVAGGIEGVAPPDTLVLPAGEQHTFVVPLRVTAPATATEIALKATVRESSGKAGFETTFSVPVVTPKRDPLLAFVSAEVSESPEAGKLVIRKPGTLSVTVGNRGAGVARNVSLSLAWAGDAGGGIESALPSATPTLAVGEEHTFAVPVTVTTPPTTTEATFRVVLRESSGAGDAEATFSVPLVMPKPEPIARLAIRSATLLDANQDGYLQTEEEATLQAEVVNDGNIAVRGVRLVVQPERLQGLVYNTSALVGELAPQSSRSALLPIRATGDVTGGARTFTVRVEGDGGVRSESTSVRVETMVARTPSLAPAAFRLSGGADALTAGSSSTLTVSVRNDGDGAAKGIRLRVQTEPESGVRLTPRGSADLSFELASGGVLNVEYDVAVNADFAGEELRFVVLAGESSGKHGFTERRALPVRQPPLTLGKTYALLVGVGEYANFAPLVNPTLDVVAVENELRSHYRVETTLLLNPSRRTFLSALYGLADIAYGADDQLLVFFSGHGWYDERLRRGYLAFADTKPLDEDPYRETFVPHEDVRTLLERLDCQHVLLMVDSCFSGTVDPLVAMASGARLTDNPYEPVSRPEYVRRKLAFRTRRYLTAGGKQYVPDGRPGQHSPFARQMLAALRSYGGSDGILTLEEMLMHLERVEPQPRSGELNGNEPGSSFVLVAEPLRANEEVALAPLEVTVTPPDAQVELIGETVDPRGFARTLNVEAAQPSVRRFYVRLGIHRVRASRTDYITDEKEVTVGVGGASVEMRLTRR